MLLLLLACPDDLAPDPEISCSGDEGPEVSVLVQPYVQWVGEQEAWIYWETDGGSGSRLDWGSSEALGQVSCGERVPALPGGDPDDASTQVHAVHLVGLSPGATIYYRARTGSTQTAVQHFRMDRDEDAMGDYEVDYLGATDGTGGAVEGPAVGLDPWGCPVPGERPTCVFVAMARAIARQQPEHPVTDPRLLKAVVMRQLEKGVSLYAAAWDGNEPTEVADRVVERDWSVYLGALRRPEAWGSKVEIMAACDVLQTMALLVNDGERDWSSLDRGP